MTTLFAVFGGVFFGMLFDVGFGAPGAAGWRWVAITMALGLLPTTPWVVISPLMVRMIRNRTQRALDVLANNACYAARPA